MNIERSHGIPVRVGGMLAGVVGGGYTGATSELDATVQHAADLLARTFDLPVTIRFNSDRESGGAWLKLDEPDGIGKNDQVGICADVMTEHRRQRITQMRDRDAEHHGMEEWVAYYDKWLSSPEGQVGVITICIHLRRDVIASDEVAAELCGDGDSCHNAVESVEQALTIAVGSVGELHATTLDS